MRNESSLHIITVSTSKEFYYPYLVKTIEKNNNNLINLGENKTWGGFIMKITLMIEYLKTLPENDIACFLDGYDVICVRDLNEMINEFLKIKEREKCKIIAALDISQNSIIKLITSLFYNNSNKDFLNSGTYIGLVKDILQILLELIKINNDPMASDQLLLNKYNRMYPNEIYIDKNNEMFLTVSIILDDFKPYVNIKNNTVYSLNGSKPFFLHANGNGFFDSILKELGYKDVNVKYEIKKKFFKRLYATYKNRLHNFLYKYYIHILLYIITIIIIIKYFIIFIKK